MTLPTGPPAGLVRRTVTAAPEILDSELGPYALPFTMVFAQLFGATPEDEGPWTCGRDVSPARARKKALAEAAEWTAWSGGRGPIEARLGELGDLAIAPTELLQYHGAPPGGLVWPFSRRRRYEWCPVEDLHSGARRLVLADFVYARHAPRRPTYRRYALSSTSGAAAHTSAQRALRAGLLELCEREAFMETWLHRLRRAPVAWRSLPAALWRRLEGLSRLGFEVQVLDLTLDLAPVLGVVACHPRLPLLTCAAAAAFQPAAALDHALMEVESAVYCRLRDGATGAVAAPKQAVEQVVNPSEHGALYHARRHHLRARFLLRPEQPEVTLRALERRDGPRDLDGLLGRLLRAGLRAYVARAAVHVAPFTTVRALVPGMAPMTFGYGLEPAAPCRLRGGLLGSSIERCARWRAHVNRFPHPFD